MVRYLKFNNKTKCKSMIKEIRKEKKKKKNVLFNESRTRTLEKKILSDFHF